MKHRSISALVAASVLLSSLPLVMAQPAPEPTPTLAPGQPATAPVLGPPSSIEPGVMAPLPLPPPGPVEQKDETTALLYSLAGTAAIPAVVYVGSLNDNLVLPATLVGLGLTVVGPSLGHFYSAGGMKMTTGMGIRVAGTGAGLVVGIVAISAEKCADTPNLPDDSCGLGGLALGALVATAGFLVGTGWDIATAPASAREANRANATRFSWHAAPMIAPSQQGHGVVTGLAVGGSF